MPVFAHVRTLLCAIPQNFPSTLFLLLEANRMLGAYEGTRPVEPIGLRAGAFRRLAGAAKAAERGRGGSHGFFHRQDLLP